MYLNILKKDLKSKKTMNMILLVFIILATMFVSSSVNNILRVTTALDDYFEMANAPDYLVTTMNKNLAVDIDETISSAKAVDSYAVEDVLFLAPDNFIFGELIFSYKPLLSLIMPIFCFISCEKGLSFKIVI